MKKTFYHLPILTFLFFSNISIAQTTWFVNDNATGANNGTSWIDAFTDLQDGIAAAGAGDEIRVKEGTYFPDGASPGDRSLYFEFKSNVDYQGGYEDANNINPQQDPLAYLTILDGNIGTVGDKTDNSYHVTRSVFSPQNILVYGFQIQNGYADGVGQDSNDAGCALLALNGGNSDITFEYCTFAFNEAQGFAGAVGSTANFSSTMILVFDNCTFTSNSANFLGGALSLTAFNNGSTHNTTFTDCIFSGNNAPSGGAIGVRGWNGGTSIVDYSDCDFTLNSATADGGAIWEEAKDGTNSITSTYSNTTFTQNSANNGGAIYSKGLNDSVLGSFSNTDFTDNSSSNSGGAIFFLMDNADTTIPFTDCDFVDNTTFERGGAIFHQSLNGGTCSPTYKNCRFETNEATSGTNCIGGAISNWADNSTASPDFEACYFKQNSCRRGGAMDNLTLNGGTITPLIVNCIFDSNIASNGVDEGWGGAIYNFQISGTCTPDIVNSTFYNNTALISGEVMRSNGAAASVANSILWGGSGMDILSTTNGGTHTITYSDVEGGFTGTGNIDLEPWLINPAGEAFGLLTASPCVNAGDNSEVPAGINFDFDGNARIQTTTVDMGALETLILAPFNNDVCSNFDLTSYIAIVPMPLNPFPFENHLADAQTNEPVPTNHPDCESQNSWCDGGGNPLADLDNSVWFSFTAPSSGNIFISTQDGGFDTQVAVWEADACADILSGDAKMVGANDNAFGQNFSDLLLECLTPGKKYFIQIDGHDGAAGSSEIYLATDSNLSCDVFEYNGGPDLMCGMTPLPPSISTGAGEWLHVQDPTGKIVASINDQNNSLGLVTPDFMINGSDDGIRTTPGGFAYLDRNWKINVANQPTTPMTVRLYFSEIELLDLGIATGLVPPIDINEFLVTKVDNAPCGDYTTNGGSVVTHHTFQETQNLTGSYSVDIQVSSFSSFYVMHSSVALPVELTDFQAFKHQKNIQLTWQTASEKNNRGFEIQKSADGLDWEKIGWVDGQGNSDEKNNYDFFDDNPYDGMNYYRLRQIDLDEKFKFSKIVNVLFEKTQQDIHIFPNPVNDVLQIQASQHFNFQKITIYNHLGKAILIEENDFSKINISHLKSGMYWLEITTLSSEPAILKFYKN